MGRAQAKQSAVACRRAYRAAGIAAEGKVARLVRYRRRRAGRRSAGDMIRRGAVARSAVMHVVPAHRIRQLAGMGFTDKARAVI